MPLLASLLGFRLLVDFAAVSNFVNYDDLLLVKWLINNAVVSFSVLEKSSQIALQRFWFDLLEMLCQPRDLFDDFATGGSSFFSCRLAFLRMRGVNALTRV